MYPSVLLQRVPLEAVFLDRPWQIPNSRRQGRVSQRVDGMVFRTSV